VVPETPSQPGLKTERFTADTAIKTGQSERAVQRDALRWRFVLVFPLMGSFRTVTIRRRRTCWLLLDRALVRGFIWTFRAGGAGGAGGAGTGRRIAGGEAVFQSLVAGSV
jgi:hypothetical protein